MGSPNKLPSELDSAALIVCLAIEKGVDPYAWFLESDDGAPDIDGVVVLRPTEFANRLSSLAFGVTVNESSKTMLEIERGLSEAALKAITAVCSYGDADPGIDVGLFLELCNARIEGGFLQTGERGVTTSLPSPKSQQQTRSFFSDDKAFETVLPSSPYDEEVLFDLGEDSEDEFTRKAAGAAAANGLYPFSRKKLTIRPNSNSSSNISNNGKRSSKGITKIDVTSLLAPAPAPAPATCASKPSKSSTKKPVPPTKENSTLQIVPDVVEDLLRKTVRQPNLNYQIAVHLGWLTPSVAVPRCAIVHARPIDDQWLALETIKMALLEGRLHFNNQHMEVLVSLVMRFAKDTRLQTADDHAPSARDPQAHPGKQSLDSSVLSAITASGLHTGLHSALAVGPVAAKKSEEKHKRAKKVLYKGKLNANWLRLYLQHLRLSHRQSSAVSEMQVLLPDTPIPHTSATLSAARPTTAPASLASDSIQKSSSMPKELRRALSGQPHSLGFEELKAILHRHPILTEAQISLEIRHRVTCWKGDQGGTNEYARALRIAQSKWSHANGSDQWRRLPEHAQMEILAELEERVLKVKREELFSAERVDGFITLDLFSKYEAFCRDTNYAETCSWKEWVEWWQCDKEMKDREVDVVRIQRDAAARLSASMVKIANKPPPNPFAWHDPIGVPKGLISSFDHSARKKLSQPLYKRFGAANAAPASAPNVQMPISPPASPRSTMSKRPSLGQTHGAELRQQLSFARQSLMSAGLGKDKALASVFAPIEVLLPPDSPRPARNKVVRDETPGPQTPNSKTVFRQWSAKKVAVMKEAAAKEEREKEARAALELKKALDAKKHFQTWCKLRAAGKYKVKMNGTTVVKKVPPKAAIVCHELDWGAKTPTIISPRHGLDRSQRRPYAGTLSMSVLSADSDADAILPPTARRQSPNIAHRLRRAAVEDVADEPTLCGSFLSDDL